MRVLAIPLLVYAAATVVLTWPMASGAADRLFAQLDLNDCYLMIWILRWDLHALATSPLDLFDANALHPAPAVSGAGSSRWAKPQSIVRGEMGGLQSTACPPLSPCPTSPLARWSHRAMNESRSLLTRIAHGSRFLGVGVIVLGATCMIAPAIAGAPVVIVVGLLLAIAGGIRATFGWRAWSAGRGPLGLVIGGLALACGLALVVNPVSTLAVVSSLVAAYLVVDGIVELLFSGRLRDEDGRAWMWGDAIFSIVLGASMWIGWPLSGLRALGVLVGLKLVSAGAVLLRVERGLSRVDQGLSAALTRLRG